MDREILESYDLIPEMDELLEKALLFSQEEAKSHLENEGQVIPFTSLIAGETLFIETHPGESSEECFKAAKDHVAHARGARGYTFCYDGYVETDEGRVDAVIVEGGMPGEKQALVIGRMYEQTEEGILFDDSPVFLGECVNYMEQLPMPQKDDEEKLIQNMQQTYPEIQDVNFELED